MNSTEAQSQLDKAITFLELEHFGVTYEFELTRERSLMYAMNLSAAVDSKRLKEGKEPFKILF